MSALLAAQQSIGGVRREKVNSFGKYTYASSENLVSAARRALILNGIVAGRRGWSYEVRALPGGENEERTEMISVRSTFFLHHAASGESLEQQTEFPALVRKQIPEDKAVAASLTTALAYWLRDILLLPRIDEAESMNKRNDSGDRIAALHKQISGR